MCCKMPGIFDAASWAASRARLSSFRPRTTARAIPQRSRPCARGHLSSLSPLESDHDQARTFAKFRRARKSAAGQKDRQRALKQTLRLAVPILLPINEAQFVECKGVVCMIGSEACLCQPLKLLCLDLGGRVVPARVMILKSLVDSLDVGRLGRCGRECSEGQECKDRDKSDRLAAPSRYHDLTDDVVSRARSKSSSSSATVGRSNLQ